MGRSVFKKCISVLIMTALIISDGSFSELKLQDIWAADSKEIRLTDLQVCDLNREEVSKDDQYVNNNYEDVVLSNTSQNATDELYMDDGSIVSFTLDSESDDYKIFLASDATGGSILPNVDKSDTATIYRSGSEIKYYKMQGEKIKNWFYVSKEDNKLYLEAGKITSVRNEFYLTFMDTEGAFHWVLTVHVLKKTSYVEYADEYNPYMVSSAEGVRQGKTATFSMKMENILGDIKDMPNVTDGYNWVVLNNNTDEESNLGEISTVGSGNTRFLQESVATFHASTDNGVGGVRIRAITNSGIINEENTTACIALTARGEIYDYKTVIPVYEWIPAANISFGKDEYNFLINSEIKLTSLITATSVQANVNPNDDYTFTIPSSQSSIAKITTDTNGNTVLKLLKAGTVVLTCVGENPSVTANCTIHIYNPTTDLTVTSNDEVVASYSGSIAKNVSVRTNNKLIFKVIESDGANEALVWNENANNNFDIETLSEVGNIKTYEFTAKEVDERTEVDLTVSTDRSSSGEGTTGNVSASYRVAIYPALSNDTNLVSTISYDGEDLIEADEFELYSNEKATVYVTPEGIDENEPSDQINWELTENSAYVEKSDYVDNSGSNVINATTVTFADAGEGSVNLKATSTSNPELSKDIKINTKKSITSVVASVGNLLTATISLGDSAKVDAVVFPEDADEELFYESLDPSSVLVDEYTGEITALKKTDSNGVKIRVYAYHMRFGKMIKSAPKAIVTVKVTVAGSITVTPENKTIAYTGSNYELKATAKEEGEGNTGTIDTSRAEWSIDNEKVAELSSNQGSAILAKPLLVGNAIITARFGEATGESFLSVTAPVNDGHIEVTGINTNISDTVDEDSYIYLPNGSLHEITPQLTANDIDSRQDDNNEYVLEKNVDYIETNSYSEGKNVGKYRFTFAGTGLYTSSRYVEYRVYPKTIGDGTDTDDEITVEENRELIYNGGIQTPDLKITYTKGGKSEELVLGKDYTLSSGQTNVGEYEITVTGKGNFTGSFVYTYEIKEFDLSENFGSNTMFKSGSQYVTSGNIADQIFNGTEVEPTSLIVVSTILKEGASWKNILRGTDYSVDYINNTGIGTATAIITGQGNFKGVITTDFNIIKKDLSTSTVGKTVIANILNQVYTGFEIKPELDVTCNDVELVEGRDYTVNYENNLDSNTKSGAASVATITGIGNYEGEVSKNFIIEQADLSDTSLVKIADIPDQYDCSTLLTPEIEVSMGEYNLIEGTDYEVSYGDKLKSTAYNFTQGTTGVVTITPVNKGNFKATSKTTVKEVNGQEVFFNIVLKVVDKKASDITIVRENGDDLINGDIYVNVERANAVNGVQRFLIETVDEEGGESEDIVSANIDSSHTTEYSKLFSYNVIQIDSTKGNKAILEITGKSAGNGEIILYSQEGFKKTVSVHVNDPATSVSITVKDSSGNTMNAINEQYVVYENHEYLLSENLQIGKTDTVSWTVDKEDIATIDETGKLITKTPGTVYVTCTTNPSELSDGGVSSTIRFTVKGMGDVSLWLNPEDKETAYTSASYTVTASAEENTDGTITSVDTALSEWSISNEKVASISDTVGSSIIVKPLLVGDALITANFSDTMAESTLKVTAAINDSKIAVSDINENVSNTPDEDAYIYLPNGGEHNIIPKLTAGGIDSRQGVDEKYVLVKDTDYTLENSFNEGDGIGTYKYTFAGKDLYTGSRVSQYRIFPKTLGDGEVCDGEIKVKEARELIYNGNSQKPELVITYEKDGVIETLENGTDYTLGNGQTNVGEYTITVTGKGNFTGSFAYTYKIHEFDLNENFGSNTLFKNGSEYVASGNVIDQVFNGSVVEPTSLIQVAVILDKTSGSWKVISNNTDYTVEYIENDKVGTATAIIKGQGNYTGTITCDFNIIKKDLSTSAGGSTIIANIESQVYTGFAIEPKLTVTCNNVELKEGRDYEVSYKDNVNAKAKSKVNATATITGIGNYEGEYSKQFEIVQADLSDGDLVTISDIPEQYECSTLLTPPIVVTMGEYTLIEGVDYDLVYGDKNQSSEYNYTAGSKGVVTIMPVSNGNFKATTKTTVRNVNGAETFFDIVTKIIDEPASNILITREGGSSLIKDAIYVNVNRSGAANGVQRFEIEAIDEEGNESEDIVKAIADSEYFSIKVIQVDSTKGNKAILEVTGVKAGSGRILLLTQGGTSRYVDVYVNDPATSVSITVKDSQGKTVSELSGQYLVYENHDYYMEAVLSVGKTDSVTWSVDNEVVATINEEGKLTTNKPGTVHVTCATNPSELSEGGVSKTITLTISKNVLAESITINGETNSETRIKQNNTLELKGVANSSSGNVTEELIWEISNPGVVEITKGEGTSTITIKAISAGTTTITYGSKLDAGVKAEITVEVYVEVTEVKLSYNEQTILAGNEKEITATFNTDAIDEFVWTSSDDSIVSISGGVEGSANSDTVTLNAHKGGTVTITVESKTYGKKATCKITVIDVMADGIYINGQTTSSLRIKKGVETKLSGTAVSGDGVVTEELVWGSSNTSIVNIVSTEGGNAVIEGLRNGTATVTYYSKTNPTLKAVCNITVYLEVSSVNVSADSDTLGVGLTMDVNCALNTGAEDKINWSVSDGNIAELIIPEEEDFGPYTISVKGKKKGTVTITATSDSTEIFGTCTIEIVDNMASKVTINNEGYQEIRMKSGTTMVLQGVASAESGNITENLDWTTSDDSVVSIVSGEGTSEVIIKAVGVGEATVTYGSILPSGRVAKCVITVYVEVTSIKFDKEEVNMKTGETTTLTGRFNENAKDEWTITSSDPSVVTVDYEDGESNEKTISLKAKKVGTVTITAKAKNYDVTKTCEVTVSPVLADKVLINNEESQSIILLSGKSMILTGEAYSASGEMDVTEELEFTTSDENVVSIVKDLGSNNVQIKAGASGVAIITFGSVNPGGTCATITIEVIREVTSVSMSATEIEVEVGKSADVTATFNDGAKDDFIWTLTNEDIVSISGNEPGMLHEQTVTVIGKQEGEVILIAASKTYKMVAQVVINVKKPVTEDPGNGSDNGSGTGNDNGTGDGNGNGSDTKAVEGPKAGTKISDKKYKYKITKAGTSKVEGEVAVTGLKKNGLTTIKIAAKVTLGGVTYKVTAVNKNAFKNNKKIKKAYIGMNVKSIGKAAFAGCTKLKNIIVNTKVLKKITKGAFKGVKKSAVVKVPKAKKKAYKKLFKKAKCKAKIK